MLMVVVGRLELNGTKRRLLWDWEVTPRSAHDRVEWPQPFHPVTLTPTWHNYIRSNTDASGALSFNVTVTRVTLVTLRLPMSYYVRLNIALSVYCTD